jgi:hypothetical protein
MLPFWRSMRLPARPFMALGAGARFAWFQLEALRMRSRVDIFGALEDYLATLTETAATVFHVQSDQILIILNNIR